MRPRRTIETTSIRPVCAHDQPIDVVLLVARNQRVDDAADEMSPGFFRWGVEIVPGDHHVVKFGMAGAGGMDAEHRDLPGDRRQMFRASMSGQRGAAGNVWPCPSLIWL